MSRCINDVNAVIFPKSRCSGGHNGNTTFLLLSHKVHGRSTIMCLTNFMSFTSIIQNTFCRSCFTGINVSHNTNVTISFNRCCTSHVFPLPFKVSKSFVSISHTVCIFTFTDGITTIVISILQFAEQTLFHCFFTATTSGGNNPTNG